MKCVQVYFSAFLALSDVMIKSHDQNMADVTQDFCSIVLTCIVLIFSLVFYILKVYRSIKYKKNEIIIFTRYPIAGKAKTRLIPELGAAGAARLQIIMVRILHKYMDQVRT